MTDLAIKIFQQEFFGQPNITYSIHTLTNEATFVNHRDYSLTRTWG